MRTRARMFYASLILRGSASKPTKPSNNAQDATPAGVSSWPGGMRSRVPAAKSGTSRSTTSAAQPVITVNHLQYQHQSGTPCVHQRKQRPPPHRSIVDMIS